MIGGFVARQRYGWHPESVADRRRDVGEGERDISGAVVTRSGFAALDGQPEQLRRVEAVNSRPAVLPVTDVGRSPLLARERGE